MHTYEILLSTGLEKEWDALSEKQALPKCYISPESHKSILSSWCKHLIWKGDSCLGNVKPGIFIYYWFWSFHKFFPFITRVSDKWLKVQFSVKLLKILFKSSETMTLTFILQNTSNKLRKVVFKYHRKHKMSQIWAIYIIIGERVEYTALWRIQWAQ